MAAPLSYRATDSWAPRDQAESLLGQWYLNGQDSAEGPGLGDVNKVVEVGGFTHPIYGQVDWLAFSRWPGQQFLAVHFRKVTPRADQAERANLAFIDMLREAPHLIPPLERERECA